MTQRLTARTIATLIALTFPSALAAQHERMRDAVDVNLVNLDVFVTARDGDAITVIEIRDESLARPGRGLRRTTLERARGRTAS